MQPALTPAPRSGMQQDPNKNNPNQASVQDHSDQILQQQLLAAQYESGQPVPHPPRPQPGVPTHIQPAAPRDHSANIDPAISGAPPPGGMIPAPSDVSAGEEHQQHQHPQHPHQHTQQQQHQHQQQQQQQQQQQEAAEARKNYGKRELSSSKRAAQNRAAQRAFRQRKEGYIRKLEEQVKDYDNLSEAFKAIQSENYQLREYIINLQSRLIDSQNEVPELPGNIDLSQPRPDPTVSSGQAAAAHAQGNVGEQPEQLNALNRIAVAGLGMRKHQHEEAAYLGANNAGGMPTKRPRTDGVDETMTGTDGNPSQISKTEGPNMSSLTSS